MDPLAGIAANLDAAARDLIRRSPPDPEIQPDGSKLWREVTYAAPIGFRHLTLDLRVPAPPAAPCPLVVFLHGGAWMFGHRGVLPDAIAASKPFDRLVREGFGVASAAYRLSGEARFPAPLHDAKAAVRWLRFHANALNLDSERFAAWGSSAGALFASLLGVTGERLDAEGDVGIVGPLSTVQTAIAWSGPSDLLSMDSDRISARDLSHDDASSPESRLLGEPIQSVPELARSASPAALVDRAAPPFLVVHGDQDHLVPFGQARRLVDALASVGSDVTLRTVSGADHLFAGSDEIPVLLDELVDFLKAKL